LRGKGGSKIDKKSLKEGILRERKSGKRKIFSLIGKFFGTLVLLMEKFFTLFVGREGGRSIQGIENGPVG